MNTIEVRTAEWQTCNVLGVDVEFHREGSGQPLVLIDGSFGFRPDGPFIGDFARNFSVIAIRLPGFGDNALPGWINSTDDYAYLGLQLLKKLDVKRAILTGCSFGGWVAAEMAAMDASRLSGLVLVGAFGLKAGPYDRLDVPDIYSMSRSALECLLYRDPAHARFDQSRGDDNTLERMARGWETMALLSWDSFFHNPKLKYRVAGIDLPCLILRGESDGLVSRANADAFASLIKGAQSGEIANCGHLPLVEQPEEVGSRIMSFISSTKAWTGSRIDVRMVDTQ
ncbi:alpha/beta fold hydrolase [Mesorhizobium hawassense]|uniref:alpha/beta fold hydrolase n=1 Tax=Mesorhizobium hawassense TaxID=1209954 RepID=UPI00142DA97C|nr:alpha/beta hydrolase [Mesorhizobium hawassense]